MRHSKCVKKISPALFPINLRNLDPVSRLTESHYRLLHDNKLRWIGSSGKLRCKQCCCTSDIVHQNTSRYVCHRMWNTFSRKCNRIFRENLERQVQATVVNLAQVARKGRMAGNDVQSCVNRNAMQSVREQHDRMVPTLQI